MLLKEIERYEKKKIEEEEAKENKRKKMVREIEDQLRFNVQYKKELKEWEAQAGIEFKEYWRKRSEEILEKERTMKDEFDKIKKEFQQFNQTLMDQ